MLAVIVLGSFAIGIQGRFSFAVVDATDGRRSALPYRFGTSKMYYDCNWRARFATDSPLEGAGFEPSVPLVRPVPEWLEKGARALCAWSVEMRAREVRGRNRYSDNRMVRRGPMSCPNALPKPCAPRVRLVGRTLCSIAL